jgi:hypothetical protein
VATDRAGKYGSDDARRKTEIKKLKDTPELIGGIRDQGFISNQHGPMVPIKSPVKEQSISRVPQQCRRRRVIYVVMDQTL